MKLFFGSIRKKIILIVLLAVAPVFFALLGTELYNRKYAVAQTEREVAGRLRGYVELQQRITDSTRTLLRTVASMPSIQSGDVESCRTVLETLLEANPIYTNAIMVDLEGHVIAAGRNHDKARKLNFSDRKQFRDAVATRGFAAGEYVVGKQTNKPIFPFGMAVMDDNGKAKGAIIIGIDLSHYRDLFEKSYFPEKAFFGLCDRNGRRLFRYPMGNNIDIGEPIKAQVYQAASSTDGPGSVRAVASDGLERIIVFEPLVLEGYDTPHIYMFIGFNYSKITERADAIFLRMFVTALSSLAIALLIAWFLSGQAVVIQLEKLRAMTKKFRTDGEAPPSGIDYEDGEVGDLARSFDELLTTLRLGESERSKVLEQLRFSERRLRAIIEGVEGISIQGYDENRIVTFWNSASEKLYGYSQQEALGQKLEDLIIPDEMKDMVIQLHKNWVEGGEQIPSSELILVDKYGHDIPVFSSHVMTDADFGKEMFCIDLDLRPLKEFEEEKKELLDRLRQSQKMEAIGTLAGGIAHDFNNILVPILGYSELLLESADEKDALSRDGLQQIYTSAVRAKELVRQILTFSRQKPSEFQEVSIPAILEEVIKLLKSTLPRNIEIQRDIDEYCPTVSADSTQLHQVIMNIATNAFHAMDANGGKLGFRLETMTVGEAEARQLDMEPGQLVCLSISDTGSGIPPEIIEKIFDPFFTTKEVGKGTGMGLSVVHGIVENMHGAIHVHSIPGEGSVFRVYFPTAKGQQEKSEEDSGTISFQALQGTETILHVDDEEPVLQVVRHTMETLGYRVVSMTDPFEALELIQASPGTFDCVLTDMSMPGMLGDEFTRQVVQSAPDMPVIICTGFTEKLTRESARELGAFDIVMKPVLLHQLTERIRSAVDSKRSG